MLPVSSVRMVDNPYLSGLGKSCPSFGNHRQEWPHLRFADDPPKWYAFS